MGQLTADDRFAIQELMARYCQAIDFERWSELPDFFTEDCTLDFGAVMGVHRGRDGIRTFAGMLARTDLMMRHYVTNCVVEGDDRAARATSYVLAFTGKPGGQHPTTGRYEDELAKVNGRWLLRVRRGIIEMPGA